MSTSSRAFRRAIFAALVPLLSAPWMAIVTIADEPTKAPTVKLGKQPDGSFMVASGQRVGAEAHAFTGRPIDLALHPAGKLHAILGKGFVLLGNADKVDPASSVRLGSKGAGLRGLIWSRDGKTLFASTEAGHVQLFKFENDKLTPGPKIELKEKDEKANPVPAGMCLTRDGKTLFIATANRNAIVEIEVDGLRKVREYPVQLLPFEPRLSEDEKTIVVTNWGGRPPKESERQAKSQDLWILTSENGSPASGTVSLIERSTGGTRHVEVGIHPCGLAIHDGKAIVSNAMSDTLSVIDLASAAVVKTIPMRYGERTLKGSMPSALAIKGNTAYVCCGGDNAIAEVDLATGKVLGFRPVGFFPVAIELDADAPRARVLNGKGNGSVSRTVLGKPGNAHDFQGSVTILDLTKDLKETTAVVAANSRWDAPRVPDLKVYQGAIKHVLYIIKENRTYDEVFGDLPQGNGEPKLCSLGEKVMPNHRKLAKEFVLFDNGYVSGTNSADGHAWSTQSIANDYLERQYVGYSRSYPDDGDDAMAIASTGHIWDAALDKGKTVFNWGEFCDDKRVKITPEPKDWFEVWEDRKAGTNRFKFFAEPAVERLRPHTSKEVLYWPLWQSDQHRADIFIRDYQRMSAENRVPNLMILSLPCDHAEGLNPKYPTPRAMMADNDLALGRVVEAISKSPQWANTCIFVIEDDAQSGPDHVDGHRTIYMALSPYSRRRYVCKDFHTTASMIRTMGLMLGLPPLNRFDGLAFPMTSNFTNEPDLTPYKAVPNNIPLDERNIGAGDRKKMSNADRFWEKKTLELDWSHIDGPDPYWLNRINWYSIHGESVPYPGRPGEEPGQHDEDDDDD
jgi:DNA-binding beta-propeller fold protein YncE